jgi:hypothetical protein
MSNRALKDVNMVSSKLACLNTDTVQGKNLVAIHIDNITGGIKVNTTDTISFTMKPIIPRDVNFTPCWTFEGSDGKTYPCVANSNGELLINDGI